MTNFDFEIELMVSMLCQGILRGRVTKEEFPSGEWWDSHPLGEYHFHARAFRTECQRRVLCW